MTSAQVVEKSVTNSGSFHNCMYLYPDDHMIDIPEFKSFTMPISFSALGCVIYILPFFTASSQIGQANDRKGRTDESCGVIK